MPLYYEPPNSPYPRQGEIIGDLFELQLQIPSATATIDLNQPAKFDRVDHPYSIVVSQDCDLEWDYKARQGEAPEGKLLTHVLFCGLFPEGELRGRGNLSNELFRRAQRNQDERYHHLLAAPVSGTDDDIPELFADFKTTFSLSIEFVYWVISTAQINRMGFLPSPYLEDFMHRLYSFLGRVATPE